MNIVTIKILGSTHSEKPCLALCLRLLSFKSDPLSAPACTDALFQAAARNPSDREAFNAMLLLTELSHPAYDAPKKFSGAYVLEALRQHRKARTHIRSSHIWLLSHWETWVEVYGSIVSCLETWSPSRHLSSCWSARGSQDDARASGDGLRRCWRRNVLNDQIHDSGTTGMGQLRPGLAHCPMKQLHTKKRPLHRPKRFWCTHASSDKSSGRSGLAPQTLG